MLLKLCDNYNTKLYIPECCCVCTFVEKSTPKLKSSKRKREILRRLQRNPIFTPSMKAVLSACWVELLGKLTWKWGKSFFIHISLLLWHTLVGERTLSRPPKNEMTSKLQRKPQFSPQINNWPWKTRSCGRIKCDHVSTLVS